MTMHDDHRHEPHETDDDGIHGGYAPSEEHRSAARDAMRVFEALQRAPESMKPTESPADDHREEPDEEDLRSILADIGATSRFDEPTVAAAPAIDVYDDEDSEDDTGLPGVHVDEYDADDEMDPADEPEPMSAALPVEDEIAEAPTDMDPPTAEASTLADVTAEDEDDLAVAAMGDDDRDELDGTDLPDFGDDEPEALAPEAEDADASLAAEAEDADPAPAPEAQDAEPSLYAADVDTGACDDVSDDPETADDAETDAMPAVAAAAVPVVFRSLDDPDEPGRKPRIALMGEFSAGKSTLSNLLIGANPLPVRVTATQLPPVWISQGEGPAYCEDLDGETYTIDLERLGDVDPAETRVVRIFQQSEFLELCDIIDMPGISDPNMSPEVWERVIGKADGVIWCTHATQAWRQSEAAVWESLDPALFERSLLLVTRFDKLLTEEDRRRVMKRVSRETEGLFTSRLPISLTQAMAAGDDADVWARSGAEAFTEAFVELLHEISKKIGGAPTDRMARPMSRSVRPMSRIPAPDDQTAETTAELRPVTPTRVVPTRVRPVSSMSRRPSLRPDHASQDSHTPF